MKTYFVVADVHGFYDEMVEALTRNGFDYSNPDHILISCGDLLDRGPKPKECIDYVMGLDSDRRILVRGNHEQLMFDMVMQARITSADHHNGTVQTAKDLTGESFTEIAIMEMHNCKIWWNYWDSLVDYAEIKEIGYVFVHGWIPTHFTFGGRPFLFDDWRNGDWKEAAWLNGMEMWSHGVSLRNEVIVCGHWHTAWGNTELHHFPGHLAQNQYYVPFIDDGIIALDACTALTHMINVLVIEN